MHKSTQCILYKISISYGIGTQHVYWKSEALSIITEWLHCNDKIQTFTWGELCLNLKFQSKKNPDMLKTTTRSNWQIVTCKFQMAHTETHPHTHSRRCLLIHTTAKHGCIRDTQNAIDHAFLHCDVLFHFWGPDAVNNRSCIFSLWVIVAVSWRNNRSAHSICSYSYVEALVQLHAHESMLDTTPHTSDTSLNTLSTDVYFMHIKHWGTDFAAVFAITWNTPESDGQTEREREKERM